MKFATENKSASRRCSDRSLIRRARAGDEVAFGLIFDRYGDELHRYCASILSSADDASDALQNAMSKAFGALPPATFGFNLRAWLYRICRNESVSMLRVRREHEPLAAGMQISTNGLHEKVFDSMRLNEWFGDVGALPEHQKSALLLREVAGLGYREIASVLGGSASAVKQMVHDARISVGEIADGRQVPCGEIRNSIDRAGLRAVRGRKLSSHLRSCDGCSDYVTVLKASKVRAWLPPLPLAGAMSWLRELARHPFAGNLFEGGSIAVLKSGTAVAAAVTIGVGATTVMPAETGNPVDAPIAGAAAGQVDLPRQSNSDVGGGVLTAAFSPSGGGDVAGNEGSAQNGSNSGRGEGSHGRSNDSGDGRAGGSGQGNGYGHGTGEAPGANNAGGSATGQANRNVMPRQNSQGAAKPIPKRKPEPAARKPAEPKGGSPKAASDRKIS